MTDSANDIKIKREVKGFFLIKKINKQKLGTVTNTTEQLSQMLAQNQGFS